MSIIESVIRLLTEIGPVYWSCIIGGVGMLGIFSALWCLAAISRERKKLSKANVWFLDDAQWDGVTTRSREEFVKWLRDNGIKENSHLGGYFRSSWSSWLGGRSPSLAELHDLVNRRERCRKCARLSAGISTLLLVMGIVGTLSSIHPRLKEFNFSISGQNQSATTANLETDGNRETVKATERVNQLIHSLGDAFMPSLFALLFTVVVVTFRGAYMLSLRGFTLDLDKFAVEFLIPRFAAKSMSGRFLDIQEKLDKLTKSMLERESSFSGISDKLSDLLGDLGPSVDSLKKAAEQSNQHSSNLTKFSKEIVDALESNLGVGSPMTQAVSKFQGTYDAVHGILEATKGSAEVIAASNERALKSVELAIETIGRENREMLGEAAKSVREIETVGQRIEKEVSKGRVRLDGAVTGLEKRIGDVPDRIEATAKEQIGKSATNFEIQGVKKIDEALEPLGKLGQIGDSLEKLPEETKRIAHDAIQSGVREIEKELDVVAQKHRENLEGAQMELKKSVEVIRKELEDAGGEQTGAMKGLQAEVEAVLLRAEQAMAAQSGNLNEQSDRIESLIAQLASIEQALRVRADDPERSLQEALQKISETVDLSIQRNSSRFGCMFKG